MLLFSLIFYLFQANERHVQAVPEWLIILWQSIESNHPKARSYIFQLSILSYRAVARRALGLGSLSNLCACWSAKIIFFYAENIVISYFRNI